MRVDRTCGVLTLILGLAACSDPASRPVAGAEAHLINGSGVKIGEATFAETKEGVLLHLQAWNLPPGPHGMHLHASGACHTPDFQTAAGHFNPTGKKHGLKNPEGPHAGDLPNLVVPENGRVDVTILIRGVTLRPGKNSLMTAQGSSLVIHQDADDERTDPDGNSGPRIACAVLQQPTMGEVELR